jgi:hypothetical protein
VGAVVAMKNLLVFIHPSKGFADYRREMDFLSKVQIDNSLAFGWKREDILIVTNFDFEYNGVKSLVVPDSVFNPKKKTVSKINAILALFEMNLIGDELFWFHDFDAFQNAPLGEVNLGSKDLALTNSSGHDKRLSTGVLFFSQSARDIFEMIQSKCIEHGINEERALMMLDGIRDRLLVLNLSHNFAIRDRRVAENYALSDKPLKVLHFHPTDKKFCMSEPTKNSLQVVYGDNSFGEALISKTLDKSFKKHGL